MSYLADIFELHRYQPDPSLDGLIRGDAVLQRKNKEKSDLYGALFSKCSERTQLESKVKSERQTLGKKKEDLKSHQATWLGWVVSILEASRGFLKTIHEFFQNKFTRYKEETSFQKNLINEIRSNELNEIQCKSAVEENLKLQKEFYKLHEEFGGLVTEKRMMELFGGSDNYKALPVLDLKLINEKYSRIHTREEIYHRTGPAGILDLIEPSDMSHAVMRGVQDDGRRFFIVKHLYYRETRCQLFYQMGLLNLQWAMGNRNSTFYFVNSVVEHGKVDDRNTFIFQKLSDLIQTGTAHNIPGMSPDRFISLV